MQTRDLKQELAANSYPGRGIVIGSHEDGTTAVIAYFIMGRSENSRNRIFLETADGIQTKAFDEQKMVDPSLIIYAPVRVFEQKTIVTNGDQTDTIYTFLQQGKSFEEALRTRAFEPDTPNFTPRISGLVDLAENRYTLSILKSANGNPDSVRRYFYEYNTPVAGEGHFIHTYYSDGNPLPSFEGEPKEVSITGTLDEFCASVWNHLNEENKVSLFVRYINKETGKTETRIVNKHQ